MTVTRISTYNLHQRTLNDAAGVQANLFQLQTQISSGYKANYFSDMGGQVEQFTALDNKIKRTEMFTQNNQITSSRIQTMGTVVDQVIDSVTSLKNLILLRRNQTLAESLGFENQLEGTWQAVAGQLNVGIEGRYLFSGTRTDVPAVDTDTYPALAAEGVPDDGYYQGSSENVTFRVQDDYELEQTVRADDPAFQKLFAALAIAKEAHAADDDDKLSQAFTLASEALEGIIDMQVQLNSTRVNVDDATSRLDSLRLYWQGVKESLINTDLVSASTQVAVNQGILQASFQVFARINSLQLSDFLR